MAQSQTIIESLCHSEFNLVPCNWDGSDARPSSSFLARLAAECRWRGRDKRLFRRFANFLQQAGDFTRCAGEPHFFRDLGFETMQALKLGIDRLQFFHPP